MTLKKFSSLSKSTKKNILLKTAPFIAERKWSLFRVMLYQVDNFYTEVFFFRWSPKAVGFRSFYSTHKLQPYLKQIDISSLLQG